LAADRGGIQERLRAALRDSLSARDTVAVSALRSALAAIGNAGAVPALQDGSAGAGSEHFAGAVTGLGAAEAERRSLTEAQIAAIVQDEIGERQVAAEGYEHSGHGDQAGRLRREAAVLVAATSDQL
jgi:uncharacterized protein YqeY